MSQTITPEEENASRSPPTTGASNTQQPPGDSHQISTILSSKSPSDILQLHLQLTLFKKPVNIPKLIYIADKCHYEPAWFHVAEEMERLEQMQEAKKWYEKSRNPHAYFKLAKILMAEYEQEQMEQLLSDERLDLPSADQSVNATHSDRNVQIFVTDVDGSATHQTSRQHSHCQTTAQKFSKTQRRFVRLLKKAASFGHEEAMYELGVLYENVNWIKSFKYLRSSLQSGWALAFIELSKGRDPVIMARLEEDVIENIQISEKDQFDYLGFAYQYGYGRKQDLQESMKMFKQAWHYEQSSDQAENGKTTTNSRPRLHQRNITNSSQSDSRRTHSFSRKRNASRPQHGNKASTHSMTLSSTSQKQIHTLLSMPEVIDEVKYILKRYHNHQNSILQRKLIREEQNAAAADKKQRHLTEKQRSLTDIYSSPEFQQIRANIKRRVGVPWSREIGRAKNLLKTLMVEGHRESVFMMGEMYSNSYPGVTRNTTLATQLYKAAAYVGHMEGMFKYANNLLNEFEWTEDPLLLTEAVLYYKKAAQLEHTPSMVNLAVLYERGLVTGQLDYHRAARLYHEAIRLGDPAGSNGLAALYMHGNGVPRNYMKTAKYLFEAIDHGDEDAKENIQILVSEPQGLVAMNVALEAFRYLASEGNKEARRFELRLQSELGYKQHWKSNIPALVDTQMHMSELHFENHGKAVDFDGFHYYTVTYHKKLYMLKAFVLSSMERTVDNVIWNTFKQEILPLIRLKHEHFLPVQNWAADMDNIYLMSEKVEVDFQYILMRTKYDYIHELKDEIPVNDLFSSSSLIGLTIAPRNQSSSGAPASTNEQRYFTSEFSKLPTPAKNPKVSFYGSDQKLEDIISIANILLEFHNLTHSAHRSISSRIFLLKTSVRMERLYLSKIFSRNAEAIGKEKEQILLSNYGLELTTKHLGFELSSYAWCAPEVIRDGKFTKASDVFSFGMLLFEFLTHTSPFSEFSNQFTVQNKIMRGETPEIPIEIQQFKTTNFFVSHITSIMVDCWGDSRSRPTMEEIIKRLNILKTRIAVHRSRQSLQSLFVELKIEQYLDRFAQHELLLDDLKTIEENKIKALFNQQMAPCSRLLQWRKLENEHGPSSESIFSKFSVRNKNVESTAT